jgi:type I restriction enzyme M protein
MERHNEISEFIWGIKEHIRDEYKEKDYEDVILPFTLLRRIDCVLEKTNETVQNVYQQYKDKATPEVLNQLLKNAAEQNFYNISPYNLLGLVIDKDHIGENFRAYLDGFSENIKDILLNFCGGIEKGLSPIYETLLRKELLYIVTFEFTKIDLHPQSISNHDMGTIFEILIRKSKETSNEKAGQFFTPREIVRLMVNLVFAHDTNELKQEGKIVSIYDPCCGTGGMLTTAKDYLLESVSENLTVYTFGQEINEQTYAIAKSDLLIKGEDAENIKRENTIKKDLLKGKTFSYMLTNPPFGDDWKNMQDFVKEEHELGYSGRFGAGLPDVSDGSFLFLQHMISKMNPQGSIIGIVFNGSPLFNGDAGGGWSNIRGWIMDNPNDYLDTIVALPKDLFYGTGIGTYIWILNNRKPANRKGKIQLINAIHPRFTKKIKSLGKKQYEICEDGIRLITDIYKAYKPQSIDIEENGKKRNVEVCKIFDVDDFKYTKVTVERPLRLAYKLSETPKDLQDLETAFEKVRFAKLNELKQFLATDRKDYLSDSEFFVEMEKALYTSLNKQQIKILRTFLGVKEEDAQPVFDSPYKIPNHKGDIHTWKEKPLPDTELRDSESIPIKQDIAQYFETEVLPFAPDAWMDREKDKTGYEIPFTKHYYEYKPLRSLEEIMSDIQALELQTETLLDEMKKKKKKNTRNIRIQEQSGLKKFRKTGLIGR